MLPLPQAATRGVALLQDPKQRPGKARAAWKGFRNRPFTVCVLDPVTGRVNKRSDFRLLWPKSLPLGCQGLISREQQVMLHAAAGAHAAPSGWASLAALSLPPVFLPPQRDGGWESMAQVWVTQASRGHWSLARAAASLPPASPPPLLPTFLLKTLVCMESSTAGRCWGWGQARGQPGPLGTGPSCHVCFAPWCQGLGMVGSSVYPALTDCCLPFLSS